MTATTSCNASTDRRDGPPLGLRQTSFPAPQGDHRPPGRGPTDAGGALFAVRVVDNPVNTYEEVMDACCRALGVSLEEAFQMAYAVDHAGSCVVCVAPRTEAEQVAGVIRSIGIEVRLEPQGG